VSKAVSLPRENYFNTLPKQELKGISMTRLSVSQLKPKQDVESIFLVKYINLMTAKDGKKYLNVILSDATGDLESRVWVNAEEVYDKVEKGSFVKVMGKVNLFQGRKQFIIQDIVVVADNEVDKDEFVVKAQSNPDEMFQELEQIVHNLDDVYIRDLLKNVISDQEVVRRLKKWQAGKTIHHAYQSGLLEHILSCSKLAVSLSEVYQVNKNYVVAGAILHDLCKIYELTDDINVEYTEEGKLVGHLVKGVELVDKYSYRIKDFPYQTKLHLKHILLSHHGEYKYGSPKIPQTSEAMLVHLIDLMDSKMHTFETIKRTDHNTGHWSGYVQHLDRIVFKGDLPFYPEYVEPSGNSGSQPAKKAHKNSKPRHNKELKQSLGDMLKDVKVDK
tara:strand:- start:23245 stop:24408 length:1164 start_codon:yes stop_codon:yes gene_type:complete